MLVVIAPLKCVPLVDTRFLVGLVVDNQRERGWRRGTMARKDKYQLAYRTRNDVSGYLFHRSYPARSRRGEWAGIETFTDRDKLQVLCKSALVMKLTCQ